MARIVPTVRGQPQRNIGGSVGNLFGLLLGNKFARDRQQERQLAQAEQLERAAALLNALETGGTVEGRGPTSVTPLTGTPAGERTPGPSSVPATTRALFEADIDPLKALMLSLESSRLRSKEVQAGEDQERINREDALIASQLMQDKSDRELLDVFLRTESGTLKGLPGFASALQATKPEKSLATRTAEARALSRAKAEGRAAGTPSEKAARVQTVTLTNDKGDTRKVNIPAGTLNIEEYIGKTRPDLLAQGFGLTQPRKETALEQRARFAEEVGVPPDMAKKIAAGIIELKFSEQTGRTVLVDKGTGKVQVLGLDVLTPDQIRNIDRRRSAVANALRILRRTDATEAGLENLITSELGGIGMQIPLVGGLLRVMGLTEAEVAEAQADRAGFFQTLVPIAESIQSEGGARRGIATRRQIDLAERIVNLTRLATTPEGAVRAKAQLIDLLEEVQVELIAWRRAGTVLPPEVITVTPRIGPDGKIILDLPEGVE